MEENKPFFVYLSVVYILNRLIGGEKYIYIYICRNITVLKWNTIKNSICISKEREYFRLKFVISLIQGVHCIKYIPYRETDRAA